VNIEYWPIERPVDYPKNARKWGAKAIEKVGASLREFGFRQPIVVDDEGVIIIGHLRRAAARSIGLKEVPVHVAKDLPPDKVRALRLADNRLHEESSWNLDLLNAELSELKGLSIDLSWTGFSGLDIDRALGPVGGLTDPDAIPPVPAVPATRDGDVWLLGAHRLTCGSSTDPAVVARVLDGRQPKLMVTDPPYGIELDSEWRDRAGLNGLGDAEPSYMKKRSEGHNETTISGDTKADWSDAFELVPCLEVAYVWHASTFTREVLNGLERIGFLYPQQIIWDKGRVVLTRTHYWYQHEPCWYVRKKNAPWFGKAGENSTIWDAGSPKFIMGGSKDPTDKKQDHPTQKPAVLMRKSILNHTEPGGLVYEPFGGSGTTLIASEETGRVCCAIELAPKFVDVIVKRWQAFAGRHATLDGDGRTFAEIEAERVAVPA
jgi:DNA modification methylase